MPETNLDILNDIIEGKEKLNIDALNILAQACAEKAGTTSAGPFKYNLDALKEIATNIKNIDGGGGGDDPKLGILARSLAAVLCEDALQNDLVFDDPAITKIEVCALYYTKNAARLYAPYVTKVQDSNYFGSGVFGRLNAESILLPSLQSAAGSLLSGNGTTSKKTRVFDIGQLPEIYGLDNWPSLTTIVMRKSDALTALYYGNSLAKTPFDNGGSGGTIYIPKALFDHLGDGSALDYKAATNWSAYDAYGTITWAQLEGSAYETYD